jgi:hypothetical protein
MRWAIYKNRIDKGIRNLCRGSLASIHVQSLFDRIKRGRDERQVFEKLIWPVNGGDEAQSGRMNDWRPQGESTDIGWRLVHKPAVQIAVRLSYHARAL